MPSPTSWSSCAARSESPSDDVVKGSLRLHGALDVIFGGLYLYLNFAVARGRSTAIDIGVASVSGLLVVAGVALLGGFHAARSIAITASSALLGFCLTVVALLVAGAAYLRGIYGPLGQGMAWTSLLVAAVLLELFGLLPLFQLRLLFRADVKRHFAGDS